MPQDDFGNVTSQADDFGAVDDFSPQQPKAAPRVPKMLTPDYGSDDWYQQKIGAATPDWIVPPMMKFYDKVLAPMERMGQRGAARGGAMLENMAAVLHEDPLGKDFQFQAPQPVREAELAKTVEAAKKSAPKTMGAARAVGEMGGGMVGDPKNWPFFLAGGAGPGLQRLVAAGFGAQMIGSIPEQQKEIEKAKAEGAPQAEIARQRTHQVIGGTLGALSLLHAASPMESELPAQPVKEPVKPNTVSDLSEGPKADVLPDVVKPEVKEIEDLKTQAKAVVVRPKKAGPKAPKAPVAEPQVALGEAKTPEVVPEPKEAIPAPPVAQKAPVQVDDFGPAKPQGMESKLPIGHVYAPENLGVDLRPPQAGPDIGDRARATLPPLPRGDRRAALRTPEELQTQELFGQARKELGEDATSEQVMARVEALRAKTPAPTETAPKPKLVTAKAPKPQADVVKEAVQAPTVAEAKKTPTVAAPTQMAPGEQTVMSARERELSITRSVQYDIERGLRAKGLNPDNMRDLTGVPASAIKAAGWTHAPADLTAVRQKVANLESQVIAEKRNAPLATSWETAGVERHNAAFQQAKAKLGPDAKLSDVMTEADRIERGMQQTAPAPASTDVGAKPSFASLQDSLQWHNDRIAELEATLRKQGKNPEKMVNLTADVPPELAKKMGWEQAPENLRRLRESRDEVQRQTVIEAAAADQRPVTSINALEPKVPEKGVSEHGVQVETNAQKETGQVAPKTPRIPKLALSDVVKNDPEVRALAGKLKELVKNPKQGNDYLAELKVTKELLDEAMKRAKREAKGAPKPISQKPLEQAKVYDEQKITQAQATTEAPTSESAQPPLNPSTSPQIAEKPVIATKDAAKAWADSQPIIESLKKTAPKEWKQAEGMLDLAGKLDFNTRAVRLAEMAKTLDEGLKAKDPQVLRKVKDAAMGLKPTPNNASILDVDISGGLGFAEGGFGVTARQLLQKAVDKVTRNQLPVADEKWQSLKDIREAIKRGPGRWVRLAATPLEWNRLIHDQFQAIPGAEGMARWLPYGKAALEAKLGRDLTTSENPYRQVRVIHGGSIGGQIMAMHMDYMDVIRAMQKDGLQDNVTMLLDYNAGERAYKIVRYKLGVARQQAKAAWDVYLGAKQDLADGAINHSQFLEIARKAQAERTRARNLYKELRDAYVNSRVTWGKLGEREIQQLRQENLSRLSPADQEKVKQYADQIYDLNNMAWEAAHDAGLVSNDAYETVKDYGKEYVPMSRLMETIYENTNRDLGSKNPRGLQLKQQRFLKTLKGSELPTQDPLEASINQHAEIIREIGHNNAVKSIVNLMRKNPDLFQTVIDTPEGQKVYQAVREVPQDYRPLLGEDTVGFYEDGKRRTLAVPQDMAAALKLTGGPEGHVMAGKVLQLFRTVFQAGTTGLNLPFAVVNSLRDVMDAGQMSKLSKYGPDFVTQLPKFAGAWAQAIKHIATQDPVWRQALRDGIAFSGIQQQLTPEHFLANPLERHGSIATLAKPFEAINSWVENATKLATYERLKAKGMEPPEAVWETRNYGGSPDFAHKGTATAQWNLLLMFFNANEKGLTRSLARMATDPKRLGGLILANTLVAAWLDGHNSQYMRADGTSEDDVIDDNTRQNYFYYIQPETYTTSNGDVRHKIWKLPKGHISKMLYNPIQDGLRQARKQTADIPGIVLNLANNVMPGQFNLKEGKVAHGVGVGLLGSTNPIIRESVGEAMNLDTYGDRPIVPRSLQEVEPQEQYNPSTSITARKMADFVATRIPWAQKIPVAGDIASSPLRLEHAVAGLTGGFGQQVLGAADAIQGQKGTAIQLPLQGDEAISHIPVAGVLTHRFVGGIQNQEEKDLEMKLYDTAGRTDQIIKTLNVLKKRATTNEGMEKLTAYYAQNAVPIALNKELITATKRLSAVQQMVKMLQQTPQAKDDPEAIQKNLRLLFSVRMSMLRTYGQLIDQYKGSIPNQ